MHVTINTSALTDEVVSIREDAAATVRMSPSDIKRVDRLKALAAAFISECRDANTAVPEGAREFAIAITNMQTAQMWSVLAATAAIAAKR